MEELERNLLKRLTPEQVAHLINEMGRSFPGARLPHVYYGPRIPAMTNHSKDRHVLAAAVVGQAQIVVTSNTRHFPRSACIPHGIKVRGPSGFLCDLLNAHPDTVQSALVAQAARMTKPPMTIEELLVQLQKSVPGFVAAYRTRWA